MYGLARYSSGDPMMMEGLGLVMEESEVMDTAASASSLGGYATQVGGHGPLGYPLVQGQLVSNHALVQSGGDTTRMGWCGQGVSSVAGNPVLSGTLGVQPAGRQKLVRVPSAASAATWMVLQNDAANNWNLVGTMVEVGKEAPPTVLGVVTTRAASLRLPTWPSAPPGDPQPAAPLISPHTVVGSLRGQHQPPQPTGGPTHCRAEPPGGPRSHQSPVSLPPGGAGGAAIQQSAPGRVGLNVAWPGLPLGQHGTSSPEYPHLRRALGNVPFQVTDESSFRCFLDDRLRSAEEARQTLSTVTKVKWQPAVLRQKGQVTESILNNMKNVMEHSQDASGATAQKRNGLRRKDASAVQRKQSKKVVRSRKRGQGPVLKGESEEIIVEVDLPNIYSDGEEDSEEVSVREGESDDPLSPSQEDKLAVDTMRKENNRGTKSWNPLLNTSKNILMFKKTGRMKKKKEESSGEPFGYLQQAWSPNWSDLNEVDVTCENAVRSLENDDEQTQKEGQPEGTKNKSPRRKKDDPKQSVPLEGLRQCSVRLVRCDGPSGPLDPKGGEGEGRQGGGSLAQARKEDRLTTETGPRTADSKSTEDVPQQPSTSSPSKDTEKPPQRDYWLQMLDRERREAQEALEAVRKRLSEETGMSKLSPGSIRSTLDGREATDKAGEADYPTLTFDERRWTLLEEEFRKQEVMRRKSLSGDSNSGPSGGEDSSGEKCDPVARSAKSPSKSPSVTRSPSEGTTWCEEDLPLSLYVENRGRSAVSATHKGDRACLKSAVAKGRGGRVGVGGGLKDDRIKALQRDARCETEERSKVTAGTGVRQRLKECRVALERCAKEARQSSGRSAGESSEGSGRGGEAPSGSADIRIDSVEMRSLALRTGPVPREDGGGVSHASFVCLQGRVGISRRCKDPKLDNRTISRTKAGRLVRSSPSDTISTSVLMVEMKRLTVVVEDFAAKRSLEQKDGSLPCVSRVGTPEHWAESKAVVRAGQDESRVRGSQAGHSLPKLKRCYVPLVRCDVTDLGKGEINPPKESKRRRVL